MSSCNKVPGAHGAVGYWGRSMHCRIQQEQTIPKIRALLQDQLLGGGLRVELWTSVHDVRDGEVAAPGTLKCTCVKASGKHADRRCFSCHGINYIPGYIKFGYETLWASSITPGLTLTDVQLNTTLKPNRLELTQTATTGTIETTDLFFTRIYPNMLWAAKNNYVTKDPNVSSVDAYFSTDSGGTWHPLDDLPTVNPTTGRIRFRIVLNRNTTSDPSPAWEIIRARFPTIPISERMGPWLLILKAVTPNKNIQDPRGIVIDSTGNNFWTAPLSFFDCSVNAQVNVDSTLDEGDMIRDPAFIQFLDGANNGEHPERWALTNFAYSDPLGYLTRQFFQARLTQQEEFTWLVW